jgi:membrane-associated HD superfamily phosphohydrolase
MSKQNKKETTLIGESNFDKQQETPYFNKIRKNEPYEHTPDIRKQLELSSGQSEKQRKYTRGPYKTKRIREEEDKKVGKSQIKKAFMADEILMKLKQEITSEGHCNCTNSSCLKLYCECFKTNRLCG